MNIDRVASTVQIVGVAFVAYLLYKFWDKAGDTGKDVLDKLGNLGVSISSGLFEIWNPITGFKDPVGETLFYTVTFPDGKRHAVASSLVNSAGKFQFNGVWYQMVIGKADKMRYAAKL